MSHQKTYGVGRKHALDQSTVVKIRTMTQREITMCWYEPPKDSYTGATLITDSPEKLQNPPENEALATLAAELRKRLNAAKSEILIITPYLVPRENGIEAMERLRMKSIRVVIITNSLASNNHLAVHSGYARYRKRMLKAGVELYEIKADSVGGWEPGAT